MKILSQRERLTVMAVYIAVLFLACNIALGSWIPPTNEKGLWFYSGLAAILLGSLLVTPFFISPADAISYSVAAGVALLAINIWGTKDTGFEKFIWAISFIYILVILIAALFSITLKDSTKHFLKKISESLRIFCDTFGKPSFVFSAVFLFALLIYHRNNAREYITISLAWFIIIGLNPLETSLHVIKRWMNIWRSRESGNLIGEVVGHQTPDIVLIKLREEANISFGDTLIVRSEDESPGIALAVDQVGFAEGRWYRAIHLNMLPEDRKKLNELGLITSLIKYGAIKVDYDNLDLTQLTDLIWNQKTKLLGLVAPETDISGLRIEIVRTDLDLEEGRLVQVMIGSHQVLYQIVNGLTKEEAIQQKNTRGYVRADAKKIGKWNEQSDRFDPVRWVPRPNAPVFLVDEVSAIPIRSAVGHFPKTAYPVSLNLDHLVTHNTAILGILGSGKTYLSLELVERMIEAGLKVICLDLTNQYNEKLNSFYNAEQAREKIQELQRIGSEGSNNVKQNVEEGGSTREFKDKIYEYLSVFLNPEIQDKLAIYNPAEFEVWRQDSKPFQGRASMATLTLTEVTRLFAETVLQVLQEQGMSDEAKCCLVLEEAHSLIPEWNSVAYEGDRTATNGTAKAILQGRKYGLGTLIITQRTANVTKSILNQCNTVFALRVFDSTGMEFLKNYIGEDYTEVLSTLEDRHAVVFGRASSCRDPVLIRLNVREDFIRVFRNENDSDEVSN